MGEKKKAFAENQIDREKIAASERAASRRGKGEGDGKDDEGKPPIPIAGGTDKKQEELDKIYKLDYDKVEGSINNSHTEIDKILTNFRTALEQENPKLSKPYGGSDVSAQRSILNMLDLAKQQGNPNKFEMTDI